MKKKILVVSAILLALFAAALVEAAPATWTIDPNHSQVGFSIRHLWSKVPGTFDKFEGRITYDPESLGASSVDVTIDAGSISTTNEKRDDHLRSADFFDVAKYPTITYQSDKVSRGLDGRIQVEGNLTMHGVTKPVTLDAAFLGAGDAMGGDRRSGFEATARINRKDFGIVWNKALDQGMLVLGDEVEIRINIEGVIRPG